MIFVTKPYLPPIEEYNEMIKEIWERNILTNNGPFVKELESKLVSFLGVDYLNYCSNGTIAIQLALQSLGIDSGEIITTPFTYVATTSAILLERCNPVYVDIDPVTLCIDPSKIEEAITPNTKAILAVHVFGTPCDVEAIDLIAKKHNLKVIYDAAHAFGVKYKGKSLLSYGDISTCSFHATKTFHTIEGGCLVCQDKELSERIALLSRFGHTGDVHTSLGTNAKVSEFHAAMGLLNLKHYEEIHLTRKKAYKRYLKNLIEVVTTMRDDLINTDLNYSYFPIILSSEEEALALINRLNEKDIFPRRYFYPSLESLPYINKKFECPISDDISKRILCLPLFSKMELTDVDLICSIIKER